MAKILIKNGKVWDGEKFLFADILTDGTSISKIREDIAEPAEFTFDAAGKIVSAGLVDIHVHMKGLPSEPFGIDPNMSSIPFGVTAVNDAGSSHGNGALLDAYSVKSTVFVGSSIHDNHADLAAIEKLLPQYGDRAIGIKVYFDTAISPVRDITALKEICDFAVAHNLKVMVHCSNSPTSMAEIVNTLSPGDVLTHIYHGGANACIDNDFEAFRLAKEKGVILDTGFAGHIHTDFKHLEATFAAGFLPDTISTDITRLSAYVRGGRYGMPLCMTIARKAGMAEADIFRAVTDTPAKVLGKEGVWGCLKEGGCADIAVFDYANDGFDLTDKAGNHYESRQGYRCILTILDGQILYRD